MVEFVCWTHLFWQLLSLVLVGNHYRSQLLLNRSKVTNPMPTQYWHEPFGERTGHSSSGHALAFKQWTFGGGHTAEAIPEVALHCGRGGSEAGRAKSRNLAQGGAQVALSLIDFIMFLSCVYHGFYHVSILIRSDSGADSVEEIPHPNARWGQISHWDVSDSAALLHGHRSLGIHEKCRGIPRIIGLSQTKGVVWKMKGIRKYVDYITHRIHVWYIC